MQIFPSLILSLLFCGAAHAETLGSDLIFKNGFEPDIWLDVTGPGFWQCQANCELVAGQFVEAGAGMALTSVGNWGQGLSFDAIRVNATISPMLQLSAGNTGGGISAGLCSDYIVGTICPIAADGTIPRVNLYTSGTIIKIELRVRQ